MTRWTRDRFYATLDRFLQQESTFWRRGLWERAGAHVSEELLSCDHELWARFFRHARLFQTPGLIGAFRHRREQRSVLHRKRYLEEARATLARERAAAAPPPLADRDAELFSEIRFDAETMAFARRDSRDLASSAERAFVHLDHALAETLGVVNVATPPWGFERNPQIRERLPELAAKRPSSFTFLWLGSGEAEGLRLALRSWDTQSVELRLAVAPGPSRPDRQRTLSVTMRSESGRERRERRSFDGEQLLAWRFDLAPGRHELALSVLDEATVGVLSNGDTRRLMAVVAALELAPFSGARS
jgi:hypothetical protein